KTKIELINSTFTSASVAGSDYMNQYNETYHLMEQIMPYKFDKREVVLRNIFAKDIIPSPVYLKYQDKIDKIDKHRYLRLEVIDRLSTLKEELDDMSIIIKEDIFDEGKKDEEITAINEKIKELEKQIVKIIS
ncbi:MAG: hypothetical protein Q4G09_05860, partial [Clostridia bacterium]|nr:hypothetical protein [Clostridia bacterium]